MRVTGVKLWDNAFHADGTLEKHADEVASRHDRAARHQVGMAGSPAKISTPLASCGCAQCRLFTFPDKNALLFKLLAGILERRLVSSTRMAVLERKRLEFVNQEKNLVQTPAYKSLLASLLLVEMQVSRADQGDGVKVLVFLTNQQGTSIAKITARAKEAKVADLIDSLAAQISKKLAVPFPTGPVDTVPEGKRFARESLLLLSHDHYEQALQAAEAAYALAPGRADHAALLVRCLTSEGLFLANPKGMRAIFGGSVRLKVDPDRLKTSLRLARRGFDIRTDVIINLPRTSAALGSDFATNILTIDSQRFYP